MRSRTIFLLTALNVLCVLSLISIAWAAPAQLTIYHFDVNTGDATLLLTPDHHAVLIDGGNKGRGLNPIVEFLNRNRDAGKIESLDYVILTHYDSDHLAGLKEVFESGWYPAIRAYDRGDSLLPHLDSAAIAGSLGDVDWDMVKAIHWGKDTTGCSDHASANLVKYFLAADAGGKHATIAAGDTLLLDHDIRLICLAANATNLDGDTVGVRFPGRRDDCASNDLCVALLVEYGNFHYLIAGDLTGDPGQKVADVEQLIAGLARDVDVYHVDHHGAETSSSEDFMQAIHPTVAIVSNGTMFEHPRDAVIRGRILSLDPPPVVYCTNRPSTKAEAWQPPDSQIADLDYDDYDGMVEITVWTRTYRVNLWRNGERAVRSAPFAIKERP